MKNKLVITLIVIVSLFVGGMGYYHFQMHSKPHPSIIWVSVDALRADSLKLYGHERETSPFLTKLGNEGIVFENPISQSSVTHMSHMSMLTGAYPLKHKIISIDPTLRIPQNLKLAAEYFKDLDYHTLLTGCIENNAHLNLDFGLGRGFDVISPYDPLVNVKSYQKVIQTLKDFSKNAQPFFAFIHTAVVHGPHFPKPECLAPYLFPYKGRMVWDRFLEPDGVINDPLLQYYDRIDLNNPTDLKMLSALYDASILCMDNKLGPFLTEIKKNISNPDGVIIVVTADHGESLGEHRLLQHGNMYRADLKVPLLLSLPSHHQIRVKTPVRSIDILPSLLDYVGIKIPNYMDGKSFLGLLEHPEQSQFFELAFSHFKDKFAVYKGDWKYLNLRDKEELYNIKDDPQELHDLVKEKPDLVFEMHNDLTAYQLQKNVSPIDK